MGTLAIDTEGADSDVYRALGFKELGKGVVGTPRILSLLTSLLEKSIQKGEMESETVNFKDNVAIFHGLRAPTINIQHYIDRIFKYAGCSPSCFLIAYIYVDRFVQQTDVLLTSLNVHRLLITSVLVAAKFIDDAFFNNAYYARVGGVSTAELNSCKRNLWKVIKSNGQSEPAELKIVGLAKVMHNVLTQSRDEGMDSARCISKIPISGCLDPIKIENSHDI